MGHLEHPEGRRACIDLAVAPRFRCHVTLGSGPIAARIDPSGFCQPMERPPSMANGVRHLADVARTPASKILAHRQQCLGALRPVGGPRWSVDKQRRSPCQPRSGRHRRMHLHRRRLDQRATRSQPSLAHHRRFGVFVRRQCDVDRSEFLAAQHCCDEQWRRRHLSLVARHTTSRHVRTAF